MSEALTDALLRRAQSGWKDVWDAGKYAFGPEGYRDLKKNIRYYGGPHLGSTVNDVLDILPELMGPGADVRDMVQGSDALTKALMRRDGIGALEGGTQLFGGLLGLGVPGSVAMFAGPGAKNANMGALRKAEGMAEQGADARKIWDETGWFQGADGKWRFEIDDSAAMPTMSANRIAAEQDQNRVYLARVLKHDKLYEAYPDMATAGVRYETNGAPGASYDEANNMVRLNGPPLEGTQMPSLEVLLHEIQHGVQARDGFARGASPDYGHTIDDQWGGARAAHEASRNPGKVDPEIEELLRELGVDSTTPPWKPWDELTKREKLEWLEPGRRNLYHRSAGEVEARNTPRRLNDRAEPPWETEDVPRDRQIVRFR